jgi:hypothetical protein
MDDKGMVPPCPTRCWLQSALAAEQSVVGVSGVVRHAFIAIRHTPHTVGETAVLLSDASCFFLLTSMLTELGAITLR